MVNFYNFVIKLNKSLLYKQKERIFTHTNP